MDEEWVEQTIELPSGELRMVQPAESAELPDDGGVEWAPMVPYWSVLWRSGVALARAVDRLELAGARVVELGCGLALPSIAAARNGARVLATDLDHEGLAAAARNARLNGVELELAAVDWTDAAPLVERGPFDLVLGADILYSPPTVGSLRELLPQLAPEALIADPGRLTAERFFDAVDGSVTERSGDGVVTLRRVRFGR